MTYYLALVEHGSMFGLVFPDCPGAVAQAEAFHQVMEDGAEVLRGWMAGRVSDGLAPPVPRGLAELQADEAPAEDFAANPVVASVPLLID